MLKIFAIGLTAAACLAACQPPSPEQTSERHDQPNAKSASLQNGGNIVGNGGDGITCANTRDVQLLDYYEAVLRWRLSIDLGQTDLAPMEKVKLAISRLEDKDPVLSQTLAQYADTFFQEAAFWDNITLEDVPDSDHIAIPNGCELKQLAVQKQSSVPRDPRYVISNDLYTRMNNNHKAGIILHEIIYRAFIPFGIQESTQVRYLNALLASGDITNLSLKEYADSFVGIPLVDPRNQMSWTRGSIVWENEETIIGGTLYQEYQWDMPLGSRTLPSSSQVTLYPSGTIKSIAVEDADYSYEFLRYTLNDDCAIVFQDHERVHLSFYESGMIWKGLPQDDPEYNWVCMSSAEGQTIDIGGDCTADGENYCEFYPSGVLKWIVLGTENHSHADNTNQHLFVAGQKVRFCDGTRADFNPNATVKHGTVCPEEGQTLSLVTNTGDMIQVDQQQELSFDEEGRVIKD